MQHATSLPHADRSNPLRWYGEGLRAAFFRLPAWRRVRATPAAVAMLALTSLLLLIALERVFLGEGARFDWRALGSGWLGVVLTAWACYLARPDSAYDPNPRVAPGPAALVCAVLALSQIVILTGSLLYLALLQAGQFDDDRWGGTLAYAVWMLPAGWGLLAEIVLVLRAGARRRAPRFTAAAVLIAATALQFWLPPAQYWHEPYDASAADRPRLRLTQEVMEAQPRLIEQRLGEIASQRDGIVDIYTITFAPYADEDVFRNESAMVSEVMRERFDANSRQIQLVNHVETLENWPWATPLNLRRTIGRISQTMNREEDILFIHLTSHGARDGRLAAGFWPMTVGSVTPQDLKTWLDEAGIRYRVLSISACYSGSWIAPLADDDTLVMTAADADHTSYGCGRGSELTFFGRAMYDEQLRSHTFSFEQAHATAREVIRQREIEAGKDDGYSNPQIHVGAGIRPKLEMLMQRLER